MIQKQDFFTIGAAEVKFFRGHYNITCDAVWLAAFTASEKSATQTVLDVGVGTGGAALCLMKHCPNCVVTGIDTSNHMLGECAKNAAFNYCEIELINADIMNWKTDRTFDVVMTNPPYFKGTARKISTSSDTNPHHNIDLYKWIRRCVQRLRPRGRFYCISDAKTSADIIAALSDGKMGDIAVIPLFGAKNTAERVLISARLGVRGGTTIYAGFSMNNDRILRDFKTINDILAQETFHKAG